MVIGCKQLWRSWDQTGFNYLLLSDRRITTTVDDITMLDRSYHIQKDNSPVRDEEHACKLWFTHEKLFRYLGDASEWTGKTICIMKGRPRTTREVFITNRNVLCHCLSNNTTNDDLGSKTLSNWSSQTTVVSRIVRQPNLSRGHRISTRTGLMNTVYISSERSQFTDHLQESRKQRQKGRIQENIGLSFMK